MLDELDVATKAREFIRLCGPLALPVSVDAYAAQIGGTVAEEALEENEDAWSFRDSRRQVSDLRELRPEREAPAIQRVP